MSNTFIVSFISITGVLISVIASVFVAKLQNKTALEKIKKELEQQYAKSLFEQRVKHYPELYALLSSYAKIIQYNKYSLENLIEFRDNLDEWNNEYAIFFTETSARLSGKFRHYLAALISNGQESPITNHDLDATKKMIRVFENSIREEIGVINTPPAGILSELDEVYKFIDAGRDNYSNQQKK